MHLIVFQIEEELVFYPGRQLLALEDLHQWQPQAIMLLWITEYGSELTKPYKQFWPKETWSSWYLELLLFFPSPAELLLQQAVTRGCHSVGHTDTGRTSRHCKGMQWAKSLEEPCQHCPSVVCSEANLLSSKHNEMDYTRSWHLIR